MGNMIDLDITLVVQLVNFLITIIVLNYLLIKPIREHLSARSALISSYTADIEHFTDEATQKISGYESALSDARAEAAREREAIKASAVAAEQETIKSAHAKAQAFLQSSRDETAKEAKAAMDALLSQVDGFAKQSMAKILG